MFAAILRLVFEIHVNGYSFGRGYPTPCEVVEKKITLYKKKL